MAHTNLRGVAFFASQQVPVITVKPAFINF
jgi:hypothetical protein